MREAPCRHHSQRQRSTAEIQLQILETRAPGLPESIAAFAAAAASSNTISASAPTSSHIPRHMLIAGPLTPSTSAISTFSVPGSNSSPARGMPAQR